LFPGETLPLRLSNLHDIHIFNGILRETRIFGILNYGASIGTVAEIRSAKKDEEVGGLYVIAIGRQRFRLLEPLGALRLDASICKVEIIEDAPVKVPKEAKQGKAYYPYSVWREYDSRYLVQQLQFHFSVENMEVNNFLQTMPPNLVYDPTTYSFWLARNLPLLDSDRQKLLEALSTSERLKFELRCVRNGRVLKCKTCGNVLTRANHIFPMSVDGVMGAYVNAYGYIHQTLTISRISGAFAEVGSTPSLQDTWFPGYAWTIIYCQNCRRHIGWRYDATQESMRPTVFWGLSRPSVLFSS